MSDDGSSPPVVEPVVVDDVSSPSLAGEEELPPFVYIFPAEFPIDNNVLDLAVGNFEWVQPTLREQNAHHRDFEFSFSSPHANVSLRFTPEEMLLIGLYFSTFLLTYSLVNYFFKTD